MKLRSGSNPLPPARPPLRTALSVPVRVARLLLVPLAALLLPLGACVEVAPARVSMPVDSAAGEVAFELAGAGEAAMVVPVWINGQGPLDFVIDTGATLVCIDETAAAGLDLEASRAVTGLGAGVGSAGRMQVVDIDSLRVGNATAHQLNGCIVDLQHVRAVGLDVAGLLGLNFLRSFRVSLDFERSIMILQEP